MNIVELRDLGITTTLTESGKLHLEARPGLMTPVLRELITRNRDYLVQELVRLAESVNMGELGELHSLMFEPETTSYAPTGEVHSEAKHIDPAPWRELAAASKLTTTTFKEACLPTELTAEAFEKMLWPKSPGMATPETDLLEKRTQLFMRRGMATVEAEQLAFKMTARDRDLDTRKLCLECASLSGHTGAWRCGN